MDDAYVRENRGSDNVAHPMEKATCSSCAFFRQHYGLGDTRIYRLYCGHCVKKRIRRKLPDQKACEHYVPAPETADTFVSREYLSRALLNYMTSLDLMPEIRDWQDLDEKNPKSHSSQ